MHNVWLQQTIKIVNIVFMCWSWWWAELSLTRWSISVSHEVCENDFLVPIPFPLPSNHSHSHSHSRQRLYIDYLKAEKYVYCVVNSKQNKIWSYSSSIVNQTHHSSVIIIITITDYHCSLFNIYQTVTACYCANTAGCSSHCRWTTMRILLFTYKICYSHSQNYSHSHLSLMGIPWEWEFPFPCTPLHCQPRLITVYVRAKGQHFEQLLRLK